MTPDPLLNRINAVGTILIALAAIVGGGLLLSYFHPDPGLVGTIVSSALSLVIGHYFGMRAAGQGQTTMASAMLQSQQASQSHVTVSTPDPATTMTIGPKQ